ncbi:MAG: DUF4124 domain-containing protein [Halioglobus sp.]
MRSAIMVFIGVLSISPLASAGVYMCTDPATGKKTFTDKACATKGTGAKVKVEPKNFGDSGHRSADANKSKTWTSDHDTSREGRSNFSGHAGQVESAKKVAGADS